MADQTNWAKWGTIAAWVTLIATIVGTALPYVHPSDPQHPIRFDFIYNQISISVWSFALLMLGLGALSFLIFRAWSRRDPNPVPTTSELLSPPPITALSPEYFKLENDHNELKNRLFEAQQSLSRFTVECNSLRTQLEVPKIAISVATFEVFEESANSKPGQIAKLVHGTNNRILIRMRLKIVNEHRIATNIQSLNISVRGTPSGRVENATAPADFPDIVHQSIQFGFPVDVLIDFWIEHSDAQSIVKNYFVITATDGTGQQIETPPQQINRVLPKPPVSVSAPESIVQPDASPAKNFDFDPKQTRLRLNADQIIALELDRNHTGTLAVMLAPVNTTPQVILWYQVDVAEVASWNERHKQFIPIFRFNRTPVVQGENLQAVSKDNGQWLVRVVRKDRRDFLTVYNDDSTPLFWPNDDFVDIEIWRFTLVTVHGSKPTNGNVTPLPNCHLLIRWDRKYSTLLMAAHVELPPEATLAPTPANSLNAAEEAVLDWVRRTHFQGKIDFQTEYPGLVAHTSKGEKIGYLIASTANGMEKLIQEADFNRYDDLRRLYVVMVSQNNIELTAAARSMLNRKLPDRISVTIGHIDGRSFMPDEEHPPQAAWRTA